jgi:hypothetical protein
MSRKVRKNKPVVKKSATTEIAPIDDATANELPAFNASDDSSSRETVFNAETTRVLRDAEAGKNLIHYATLDEMFEDLGI